MIYPKNTWQHKIYNLQFFFCTYWLHQIYLGSQVSSLDQGHSLDKKKSSTNLAFLLGPPVIRPVKYIIYWNETGRWTPQDKILRRAVSLTISPLPWKWSPYISTLFSNFYHWLFFDSQNTYQAISVAPSSSVAACDPLKCFCWH